MSPTRFKVCINFPSSCVNHWLDGQDHSFFKAETTSSHPIVRNHRFFVHCWSNTMSNQITNNPVTTTFSIFLNSCTDITDTVTNYRLFNTKIHGFTGYFHKVFNFIRRCPNRIGPTGVSQTTSVRFCVFFDLSNIIKVQF